MTGAGWQDIAAGMCVLAALAFLVRRRLRRRHRASPLCEGCDGCGQATACAHPEGPVAATLISLDDLTQGPEREKPGRP